MMTEELEAVDLMLKAGVTEDGSVVIVDGGVGIEISKENLQAINRIAGITTVDDESVKSELDDAEETAYDALDGNTEPNVALHQVLDSVSELKREVYNE